MLVRRATATATHNETLKVIEVGLIYSARRFKCWILLSFSGIVSYIEVPSRERERAHTIRTSIQHSDPGFTSEAFVFNLLHGDKTYT